MIFQRIFTAISFLCLISAAAPALPGHGTNPAAIEAVEAGELDTADASWWGFNPDNSTRTLQQAFRSKARTIIVPYMGQPWIVNPVRIRSHKEIIFEPGVVVMALKGQFKGMGDSLLWAENETDITLRGYGARLLMHKADYLSNEYEKSEWRMGIRLRSCQRVTIEGLTIESTGGDGVYIGRSKQSAISSDIVLRDLRCIDNIRQGISVATVENLLIENCYLAKTGGRNPEAGIDLEPNKPDERLVNIKVRNCIMENNTGPGVMIHCPLLANKDTDVAPVSITFENCLIRGGEANGIVVSGFSDMGPKGSIEFRDCTIENVKHLGLIVYGKSAEKANVRFINCKWGYNCADPEDQRAPIRFRLWPDTHIQKNGGVEFINCFVFDDRDRPAVDVDTDEGSHGLHDIHGSLTVINTKGMRAVDWKVPLENVDLAIIDGRYNGETPRGSK